MGGWADVGKPQGSGGGRFIQFEEGAILRMRILDDEPHTVRVHKISQPVGPNGEDVFRIIPATQDPDDSYILNNTSRYPEIAMHALRVFLYDKDLDDNAEEIDGEFKVLQGGTQIFKQLKALYERHKDITKFDIELEVKGSGREDREYLVSASPTSFDVDVEQMREQMLEDEAMALDVLFPPVSGEEQKKLFDEANFDIDYDPARDIAESMSIEEAKGYEFTFGKHKGRTVGEVMVIDAGWLKWGAEKITSNDEAAAACRVAVAHLGQVEAPKKQKAITKGKTETKAKTTAKPAKNGAGERDKLVVQVNEAINSSDKFKDDPMQLVEAIKSASGGKTRVKDLNADQLKTLLENING